MEEEDNQQETNEENSSLSPMLLGVKNNLPLLLPTK